MKNKLLKAGIILTVLAAAVLVMAGAGAAAEENICTDENGNRYVDNCLIIRWDVSTGDGMAVAGSVTVLNDFKNFVPGMALIKTPEGMTVPEAVAYYSGLPGVLFAEPDYVQQLDPGDFVGDSISAGILSSNGSTTPNDEYYGKQWGLQTMNVPEAWKKTTGSSDVVVAVIDTGINYNHEDLKNRMWTNADEIPDNNIDDDNNGYVDDYYGYNFIDGNGNPKDDNGHGTHVAGIIGAEGNNGIGVTGVAQDVRLMAVKIVYANGTVKSSTIIDAIQYAVNNGADIMNMSFCCNNMNGLSAVVTEATKQTLLVSSAGNFLLNNDAYSIYPSCYESNGLISIAALDKNDSLSSYSDYGSYTVDVAAPGGDVQSDEDMIYSTCIDTKDPDNNSVYKYMAGTSMAAPMVSGLAALLLSQNKELTPTDLKCIIMATVTKDSDLTGKVVTGGRVNAGEALKNAVHNKYHIVNFSDGTKEIGSQVVETGNTVSRPADPTLYYKKFLGWYTDRECTAGNEWSFSTKVTTDMILYAKWEDDLTGIDTRWYDPEQSEYHIATADELRGLAYLVNTDTEDKQFEGKTVVLDNDISLTGTNWIPIGVKKAFRGTFDGNNKTISGLSINLPTEHGIGLFGDSEGTIKNLTLKASDITGYNFVGTLCGAGTYLNNVSVTVETIKGHDAVGGIMGYRETTDYTDDDNISVTVTKGIYADSTTKLGIPGVGGAIGYGGGNNITVTIPGEIVCENKTVGGYYVGGAFGYAPEGFRNVHVYVNNIYANIGVGGIAGYAGGDISNSSAVVGNIDGDEAGGAIGYYYPTGVSNGNTIKDVFVSVNGNAAGGAIGFIKHSNDTKNYKLTIENVLVTGNLTCGNACGGIAGSIGDDDTDYASAVILKNCVSLPEKIGTSAEYSDVYGRIYGGIFDENASVTVENSYGWEGTVNYQGELFNPSDVKNGENVATTEVWNNQSFFENLGWDFSGTWKMNSGNANFVLPVLENTRKTGKLNAAYMTPQTTGSSSSVTAFFGEKDGSDFTFKKAVVITKATLPGASSATVTNTSGSGWYTCSLSTDGTNGTVYFQVPLDVIAIKGYTVNDVSMLGCRTTYLGTEGQYAKYSAVITGAGSYTIDFEKDAAAAAVEKVVEAKPVTEQKQAAAEKVQETVEQKQTTTQTAAKSPVPVLGILAGLGIAGVLVLRRRH